MDRVRLLKLAGAGLLAVVVLLVVRNQVKVYFKREASRQDVEVRQLTLDELRPVGLAQCNLERFGEAADGGYMLCSNLLSDVKAAYSYGISGYDQWGCDASTRLGVPTHQYDCFNTTVPLCPRGRTVFHPECVGPQPKTEEGRPFDSIANQLARNGDGANHVVLKIDVEGAEWDSFEATPDDVLNRIDQLVVEFHGVEGERSLRVIQRLKRFFHVAWIHSNNSSCGEEFAPFPSWAYEVLFVSRRLDSVDAGRRVMVPHPLDAPNNPKFRDCPMSFSPVNGRN